MSNQRGAGKKLIGAHMSEALQAGIALWMEEHPGSTQAAFVMMAVLEKLKREGFDINGVEALRDERSNIDISNSVVERVNYLRKSRDSKKKT